MLGTLVKLSRLLQLLRLLRFALLAQLQLLQRLAVKLPLRVFLRCLRCPRHIVK